MLRIPMESVVYVIAFYEALTDLANGKSDIVVRPFIFSEYTSSSAEASEWSQQCAHLKVRIHVPYKLDNDQEGYMRAAYQTRSVHITKGQSSST